MPQLNLTEDSMRRLAPTPSGRAVFTDMKLRGFSVVVGRQSRSFYAQRDVRGKTHKVFLGRHGDIVGVFVGGNGSPLAESGAAEQHRGE